MAVSGADAAATVAQPGATKAHRIAEMDVASTIRILNANGVTYRYFSIPTAEAIGFGKLGRLPYSLKILFESLLRNCHWQRGVAPADVMVLGRWLETPKHDTDLPYFPSRIVMPDASALPLLADLAAMRDAMISFGADPALVNPHLQVDVVIDHSVIADIAGRSDAVRHNLELEYKRNSERYEFLRWAQQAFKNLRIVPPGHGIIHQVNLEFLATVVCQEMIDDHVYAYPDTVMGMDSHTPMINALGVLGWGCGGIEAGAAMLEQPVSLRMPDVIGVRLVGVLKEGVTATDLVLTVTEQLRKKGVVQKFVEFCGSGLATLGMPARATIANMAPEYGATVGYFPIDHETLAYLRATGREESHVSLVQTYAEVQGLWHDQTKPEPIFTDLVEIDLSGIEPSIAGPGRPQDRLPLSCGPASIQAATSIYSKSAKHGGRIQVPGTSFAIGHGDIAIAAITSCTNTSNPQVIIGAALLARNAVLRGLSTKPWVKTSFSPGSTIVADYLAKGGLQSSLDALGFHVTGFGCMTCMGNSGPLGPGIEDIIEANELIVASVLSGNRNFEGRIHSKCRVNYLASPPLVVAYAIAGSMKVDLTCDPIGNDREGKPVYLADIWPPDAEINAVVRETTSADLYVSGYEKVFVGDPLWRALAVRNGRTFEWDKRSTYIRQPPLFSAAEREAKPIEDVIGARALAILGDSVTTDHISPIGEIARDSDAGRYLLAQGVSPADFNTYGARRMNHEVMTRGTLGSRRLRNEMTPDREGSFTRHMPDGEVMSIFDATKRYTTDDIPLIIIAGAAYGTGSSRDWAAKGVALLGVRAIVAEGFERIHRSNLIGMGVLPLQFAPGQTRLSHGLDGTETYDIVGLRSQLAPGAIIPCRVTRADGTVDTIEYQCRIDTTLELEYIRHGGILPYMLRKLLAVA
jgi:aconitate hydratase